MKINFKNISWLVGGVILGLLLAKINLNNKKPSSNNVDNLIESTPRPIPLPTDAPISKNFLQVRKGSIKAEYPLFWNTIDDSPEFKIDQLIEKTINEIVSESDVTDIKYKITNFDDNVVSVSFAGTTYGFGAAHPNQIVNALNYSFKQQKVLSISDILKIYNLDLNTISINAINQLSKTQPYLITEGLAPKLENYNNFIIQDDHLIFIFQPEQIAPNVSGTITYTVDLPKVAK